MFYLKEGNRYHDKADDLHDCAGSGGFDRDGVEDSEPSGEDFTGDRAAGDGDQTAFPGAFCTETVDRDMFFKLSGEKILKSNPGYRRPKAEIRKSGFFSGNRDTYMRRGSKRISLYVINGQKIVWKAIDSFQTFISRITFLVYRRKLLPKLCGCKHTELLSHTHIL